MTHNTPHIRKDKPFPSQGRTSADQIVWECKVVDYLQKETEYFNPTLKNFQLKLEME
jgi:hypothetical protein